MRVALRAACVAFVVSCSSLALSQESGPITEREIAAAIEKLKADPNLAEERTVSTLKWVDKKKEEETRKRDWSWLNWLGNLFSWFAQSGRFLFWGVLALLAAFLAVYLWRLFRGWRMPERMRRIDAPSFVRDLDIRPESLPDDIGATARKLWDGGEHRAALSLLYRGLLSRLVHVHHVPIKDSSTEGDCLALAARHLAAEDRKVYVTSLVRVWQRAVYGGETIPDESVHALCAQFAGALDTPDAPAAAPGQAAGMTA